MAEVTLVAALASNGIIGSRSSGIPWHGKMPGDSAHFRKTVAGQHVLVGRRTFEEMQGWFQTEIVHLLSRNESLEGAVTSIEAAIDAAESADLYVIGGAEVYAAALPWATRMILSHVDCAPDGGVRFPAFEFTEWQVLTEARYPADESNAFALRIVEYQRRSIPGLLADQQS